MSTRLLLSVSEKFAKNVSSVQELVNFDRVVLEFAIEQVRGLDERLERANIKKAQLRAVRTIQHLENVRKNNSLRPQYAAIFNQAVVLLVSYFGSAVSDCFKAGVAELVRSSSLPKAGQEPLKVSLQELVEREFQIADHAGDLVIAAGGISFQDMGSIARAWKNWFSWSRARDDVTNDIILGQACRHAIVHSGAVVDRRLLGQVSGAVPRTLKRDLRDGQELAFEPGEIDSLAGSMRTYLDALLNGIGETTALEDR